MLSQSMKTAMAMAEAAGQIPSKRKPAPKRIIICCDGTWQSAVSGKKNMPSNVTRLARDLERVAIDEEGNEWQQIVWYDSGVGTTSGFLGIRYEGMVGSGLEGNVIEAYNFVVLNYNEGDKIYCFGFSRGAYTARTIAGLISDIGICEPSRLHKFHELWEAYKANEAGTRFFGSQAYWDFFDGEVSETKPDGSFGTAGRENWATGGHEIEVVGVFDTVGAIGLPAFHGYKVRFPFGPDKSGFHNVSLNRNVRRAFQALALDEHREAFSPTLWHLPEQKVVTKKDVTKQRDRVEELRVKYYATLDRPETSKDIRQEACRAWQQAKTQLTMLHEQSQPPSELKQVWFPGVHINAGGGSSDTLEGKGDLEEISNITFAWLVDQIRPYLGISEDKFRYELDYRSAAVKKFNEKIRREKEKREAEKEAVKTESWGRTFQRMASSAVTAVMHPINTYNGPDLEPRDYYGWGTGEIIDSYSLMYKVGNGSKLRTPGAYVMDGKTKGSGETCEEIHPTVGYRLKMTAKEEPKLRYHPAGFEGVERRQNKNRGWEYVFGDKVLPEYKMKKVEENEFSFERCCIEGEAAREYVAGLDRGN